MRFAPVLSRSTKTEHDHSAEQVAQRERRRKHLTVVYGEGFDLLVEVHDIARPLADRVGVEPRPLVFRDDVADLAESVHSLAVAVFDLVTAADARRRTAHLGPNERGRAMKVLAEIAERPAAPAITDAMLSSGLWVQELCDLAGPYGGRLSDLLAHALAPGARRGLLSPSEVVVEALRLVDRSAVALERHLDRAALTRAQPRRRAAKPNPRAELAKMGVHL